MDIGLEPLKSVGLNDLNGSFHFWNIFLHKFIPSPPSFARIRDSFSRHFLQNGPSSASFSFIYGLFKQTIQILQQIQTHNLPNISLCL